MIFIFYIIPGLLCSVNFLMYSKVIESNICIYFLFLTLSSIMFHHKWLVPCAIQQDLIDPPLQMQEFASINPTLPVHPTPSPSSKLEKQLQPYTMSSLLERVYQITFSSVLCLAPPPSLPAPSLPTLRPPSSAIRNRSEVEAADLFHHLQQWFKNLWFGVRSLEFGSQVHNFLTLQTEHNI